MTLVALWVDWMDQRHPRLVCQADSRVSNSASRKTITDHSAKLFRIPVQASRLQDLDLQTAVANRPYFSSAIGLAYAGDCLLALHIVSLLSQTLSNLVIAAEGSPGPVPTWAQLKQHITLIVRSVAREYKGIAPMHSDLVTFGLCPSEGSLHVDHHSIDKDGAVVVKPIDILKSAHFAFGSGKAAFDDELGDVKPMRRKLSDLAKLMERATDGMKRDEYEVELALTRQKQSERFKSAFDKVIAKGRPDVGGHVQMVEIVHGTMAVRKRTSGDLFGIRGVETVGPFSVILVSEPSFDTPRVKLPAP